MLVNGHAHTGWSHWALPINAAILEDIYFSAGYQPVAPAFYRFFLQVVFPADTFLDMDGWGKGCVVVNGFTLGRFWSLGPQRRLYLPAPLLIQGLNEVIVFETEGVASGAIAFEAEPKLG